MSRSPLPAAIPVRVHLFGSDDPAKATALEELRSSEAWSGFFGSVWADVGAPLGPVTVLSVAASKADGLGDELLTQRESLDACSAENRWAQAIQRLDPKSGIVVVVGGTIATPTVNRFGIAGTGGPFNGCAERIQKGHAILVGAVSLLGSPDAFVHEVGHMFGLDHAEARTACGSDLVPRRDGGTAAEADVERRTANLMRTGLLGSDGLPVDPARAFEITADQRERVLEVVCNSAEVVGARPIACESRQ